MTIKLSWILILHTYPHTGDIIMGVLILQFVGNPRGLPDATDRWIEILDVTIIKILFLDKFLCDWMAFVEVETWFKLKKMYG